jgi:hypothetical protein
MIFKYSQSLSFSAGLLDVYRYIVIPVSPVSGFKCLYLLYEDVFKYFVKYFDSGPLANAKNLVLFFRALLLCEKLIQCFIYFLSF